MAMVGNLRIVLSEKIVLLLHPHVDIRTVFISFPSLAVAVKHIKRHARRAQKRQADFDWLNPHSLWPSQPLIALQILPKIQLV